MRIPAISAVFIIYILPVGLCYPPPPPPFDPPGYTVLGSLDVSTGESTIFSWRGDMMILENIFCGYIDHYGQWNPAFKHHSYARIRELHTGKIISNISLTVGTSFVSIFVDLDHDKAWLSALDVDRCEAQCGVGVLAISSGDLVNWESSQALPNFHTCNTQVARVTHPPSSLPPHRYVMILEPFSFMLNNNQDGDLSYGWFAPSNVTHPSAPSGGPSIRFEGGYYYVITGGHNVMLTRSKDLQVWEPARTLIAPTPNDALTAPLANFPGEEAHRKGYFTPPQQEGNYTRWDYNSNDGDVCCSGGQKGSWLVWGASSQGSKCQAAHCSTNAVGFNPNVTLEELLERVFA